MKDSKSSPSRTQDKNKRARLQNYEKKEREKQANTRLIASKNGAAKTGRISQHAMERIFNHMY